MHNQKRYAIFETQELHKINFEEVLETSIETLRKSSDGLKTFVKWNAENVPTSIQTLETMEGPYNHQEIMEILDTSYWSPSIETVENDN